MEAIPTATRLNAEWDKAIDPIARLGRLIPRYGGDDLRDAACSTASGRRQSGADLLGVVPPGSGFSI